MRPIATPREYDVPVLAELNNRFSPEGLTLPRSESFVEAHLDDYRVIRDDDGHVVGCVCIDEYSPSLVELVSLDSVDAEPLLRAYLRGAFAIDDPEIIDHEAGV